ncbi:MAG: bifunctional riboflavin kinase/FAD synthetase [Ardenticatenia bacterium]|nr:bifunctional riboflavin kinase/FAD synthetase [Ardenticatenia bacterium]
MLVVRDDFSAVEGSTVLTVGKFDGLHVGHQALIRLVKERAKALGIQAGLVTFDPHPAAVLRPEHAPPLITPLPDKLRLLETWGMDVVAVVTFSRHVAEMKAAEFLELLWRGLRPQELIVGHDFRFGHRREGDVQLLRAWAADRGVAVHVLAPVLVNGERVSGSRIRALIAEGRVEEAVPLLGRPLSVTGPVVEGDQRGRQLGVPTANIVPSQAQVVPANGVYVTLVEWDGACRPGVTNVGVRPTVDGSCLQVESHVLGWEGNLYGVLLTVHFLHRLRGERKFPSVADLAQHIKRDIAAAQEWFALHGRDLSDRLGAVEQGHNTIYLP